MTSPAEAMESSAWERRRTGASVDGALPVYMSRTSALSPPCILGATWYCGVSASATCLARCHWLQNLWSLTQRASLALQGLLLLCMLVSRTEGDTLRRELNPEVKAPLPYISPIHERHAEPRVSTFAGGTMTCCMDGQAMST